MINKLTIEVIPHAQQRYSTIGDYVEDSPGIWRILVSDTGDWKMNALIAFHEVAELIQTEAAGIAEPIIKAFDERFEASIHPPEGEPGDQPDAPYRQQHSTAEAFERLLAAQIGVDWQEYDKLTKNLWRE